MARGLKEPYLVFPLGALVWDLLITLVSVATLQNGTRRNEKRRWGITPAAAGPLPSGEGPPSGTALSVVLPMCSLGVRGLHFSLNVCTGFRGRVNLHPWKPDVRQTGTERVLEFWDSLLEWQLPGLITQGISCWAGLGNGCQEEGVACGRVPKGPVNPSCVYSHTVTVPRGPGTLEGLGSSELIRSSHIDDKDIQSSCAEGPNEPTGGRDFTAYKGFSCWLDSLSRSSSLMVKGSRLDPSDRWAH